MAEKTCENCGQVFDLDGSESATATCSACGHAEVSKQPSELWFNWVLAVVLATACIVAVSLFSDKMNVTELLLAWPLLAGFFFFMSLGRGGSSDDALGSGDGNGGGDGE